MGLRVGPQSLGSKNVGFRVYWVAAKGLISSYCIGETLSFTTYNTHYRNLAAAQSKSKANIAAWTPNARRCSQTGALICFLLKVLVEEGPL